jgi:RHS repeat-associated protein
LGTYAFQYDDYGRVIHVDEPFGVSLTFAYDDFGNRILVRDSFGTVEESTYDVYGNLVTRILTQGEYVLRIDQTFDGDGRVLTKSRYSDAAGTVLVVTSVYEYDLEGRVTSIVHKDGEGETLAAYAYAYDSEGRLIAKTDHGVTTVYVYDAQDQLIEAGEDEFDYDANGNREMAGYETGDANRIEADGTWSYQHDAEGNMVKKTLGEEDVTWTFGYNHRRQMIWAEKRATDGGTLLKRSDYGYDVFGNRIVKSVTMGETTTTQHFAQDGWNPAKPTPIGNENFDVWADLTDEDELDVRYLRGDAVDQIEACVDGDGPGWLLTDYQGSVRDVTNDEGDLIANRDYGAFGFIIAETGGAWFGRFGYAGREWDAELGMYHNRGREFDPLTGRFTGEDPLGLTPDTNPFRFVGNSPTNYTDPSGLEKIEYEYPFNKKGHVVLNLSVDIRSNKLAIELLEGKEFHTYEHIFNFYNIVEGSPNNFKDTDSAQVAVRWTNKEGKEVGYRTNASLSTMARGTGDAAEWTRGTAEAPNRRVAWNSRVPDGATHVEVLVIYTDILYGTPHDAQNKNGNGDLPAIIGSWTGDWTDKKGWKLVANSDELFKPLEGYPNVEDYAKVIAQVRKTLKDKTGYNLVARPAGLEGLHYPPQDTYRETKEKIEKIINEAVKKKQINSDLDTGFDIDPETKRP